MIGKVLHEQSKTAGLAAHVSYGGWLAENAYLQSAIIFFIILVIRFWLVVFAIACAIVINWNCRHGITNDFIRKVRYQQYVVNHGLTNSLTIDQIGSSLSSVILREISKVFLCGQI